ncbi:hypothetical protein CSOJ01_12696 [Colletotrichum sojae]|uniref:Uncharacterized protein n=1 Tax=Colletotrichum sojae TaxID=2175907 RepID=A0A8H6MLH6_9PEZI|nr:hypothetical protein CSOJ01_12696 [Colletotrichum sojae]
MLSCRWRFRDPEMWPCERTASRRHTTLRSTMASISSRCTKIKSLNFLSKRASRLE